jgi:heme/copper-type cytochrome/quinol oxidase subunit 2
MMMRARSAAGPVIHGNRVRTNAAEMHAGRIAIVTRATARSIRVSRSRATLTCPAVTADCIHNRARLYHIHHRPLYHAIGEADRYAFSPARIEVRQGDIVKITLIAEDIAHSFTIDEYRISKRASPGRSVTFEFCADRSGRFVFYCNLTADEGCQAMRGELIVR